MKLFGIYTIRKNPWCGGLSFRSEHWPLALNSNTEISFIHMRWVVLSNVFVVNTFFRDRKKSVNICLRMVSTQELHKDGYFYLSKAVCVLSDVRIWAVKEVVKFDVLEESLFPFIISNVSTSTISASLCWNWGIFHTIGWAFSPRRRSDHHERSLAQCWDISIAL